MVDIWFISDTHFGHANILTFKDGAGNLLRNFDSVDHMNQVMMDNWCKRVKPGDHVYHLGDVALHQRSIAACISPLPGKKRLIRGNHDIYRTRYYIKAGFEEIHAARVLGNIIFTHIPIHPDCLGRFRANVHGHRHSAPDLPGRYLNICVEKTNYSPIHFDEVQKMVGELEHGGELEK